MKNQFEGVQDLAFTKAELDEVLTTTVSGQNDRMINFVQYLQNGRWILMPGTPRYFYKTVPSGIQSVTSMTKSIKDMLSEFNNTYNNDSV